MKYNSLNNKIRLVYVYYEVFNRAGIGACIGKTYGVSSPFTLPEGMTIDEACKVVSYLSEKVENENDIEPASEESVAKVSGILQDYGFEKNEGFRHGHYHAVQESYLIGAKFVNELKPIEGVVDLITVGCDYALFKKSEMYNRYFDWFTEGVTKREINKIYDRILMDMSKKIQKIKSINIL